MSGNGTCVSMALLFVDVGGGSAKACMLDGVEGDACEFCLAGNDS